MTLPAILLGILISTLYGAGFHLWKNGGVGRLILYLIFAWFGFWIGQIVASSLNWTFLSLGQLHLGFATLVSFTLLFIGHWLSRIDKIRK